MLAEREGSTRGADNAARRGRYVAIGTTDGLLRRVLALALAAAFAPGCGEATARAAYRGDRLCGTVEEEQVRWFFETGVSLVGPPAPSRDLVFCGGADRTLYALHVGTGKAAWQVTTEEQPRTAAVFDADHVYFGTRDGRIHAIDAARGNVCWSFAAAGPPLFDPVTFSGIVCCGVPLGTATVLYGIDGSDGSERWSASLPGGLAGAPACRDGVLYAAEAGRGGGALEAVRIATGEVLWKCALPRDPPATGVCLAGRVACFGTAAGALAAVDTAARKLVWMARPGQESIGGTLSSEGEMIFAATREGSVYAFAAASGALRWRFAVRSPAPAGLCTYEGMLYVADGAGHVIALDVETGLERWRYRTGHAPPMAPRVAQGVLYFAAARGRLAALPIY